MQFLFILSLSVLAVVFAAPAKRAAAPTVSISSPGATIVGSVSGSVDSFNGIPFAQPPVGALRLKPPQPLTSALGTVTATGTAKSCPQFPFDDAVFAGLPASVLGLVLDLPLVQNVSGTSEDCLTVNVMRPTGTNSSSKLPVLFWIFGGGFELGSTQMYNGASLVQDSISQGFPMIFVAVNYRVGGFGFLPGKEILADGSSNLGLLDQRLGLQWTADNIADFGGDPEKVTIWGESAGAISVFDQLVLYDGDHSYKGKPLFRGAMMDSGSMIPADPVDCPKGQFIYDTVVKTAGCSSASDTLDCLRGLDYNTFMNAEDEGTLFAIFQSNLTTTTDVVNYLSDIFFADATTEQIEELVATYQNTTTDGSPFRTGDLNNLYPQFKRLAAILGDLTFTLTRRVFLNIADSVYPDVPFWSYLASYDYGTPFLGSLHGGDLLQVFYGILPNYASASIHNYYFSFVYNLDPNNHTSPGPASTTSYPEWPRWSSNKQLINFKASSAGLIDDDFRSDTYDFLVANKGNFHI